jgi:hypothetical protein
MRFEVPVALENVELVAGFVFVVPSEGPGSCMLCAVLQREIDGQLTSDEVIVLYDVLLDTVSLLVCAHDIGSPRPKQMISQDHPKGSFREFSEYPGMERQYIPVTFGDLADNLVCNVPSLTASTILDGTEDYEQARRLQKGDFCHWNLLLPVADCDQILSLVREKEAEGGSKGEEKEISLTGDVYREKKASEKTVE